MADANVEKQLWISVLTSGTVSVMGTSCPCLMSKACGCLMAGETRRDRKGFRLDSHPQKVDWIVQCSCFADLYVLVVLGIGNGTDTLV